MHVCMYISVCICMHTHMYTYSCTYIHACTRARTHTRTHEHTAEGMQGWVPTSIVKILGRESLLHRSPVSPTGMLIYVENFFFTSLCVGSHQSSHLNLNLYCLLRISYIFASSVD